jgi:hypothetical protein
VTRRSQAACRQLICGALTGTLAVTTLLGQSEPATRLTLNETLQRVSARVEQWYSRAQTVVTTETVTIQPLEFDLTPAGFSRRLAYELRVAWDPSVVGDNGRPAPQVTRQILNVNGRAPKESGADGCMDPKPVSPEPLEMLLPWRLADSRFSAAGFARIDNRAAMMIDYTNTAPQPPEIKWTDDCVSVDLPGRSKGRIWIDVQTYEVLRLDDRLVSTFEFPVPQKYVRQGAARSMSVERAETSIRYRNVAFDNPTETLLMSVSMDSLTVMRGTTTQRTRFTQRFSNYRRFLTGARLLD